MEKGMLRMMWEATRSADVQSYLRSNSLTWDFSTLASLRLNCKTNQIFKKVSEGILGSKNHRQALSDFELLTTFREAEYIMNCRPLGKYSSDEEDLQPLRPLDLMMGYMETNDDLFCLYGIQNRKKN